MPDPYPTLVAKHLGYLIAAVDRLATALASHLVVRSGAYATLTHVVYVYSSVIVERHVTTQSVCSLVVFKKNKRPVIKFSLRVVYKGLRARFFFCVFSVRLLVVAASRIGRRCSVLRLGVP